MRAAGYIAGMIAIAAIACTKEMNIKTSPSDQLPTEGTVAQVQEEEGLTIIGNITDEPLTKTQYTYDEGIYTFSWTQNDEIQLIVYKTAQSQDKYRLYAKTTAASSRFENNEKVEKHPIGSIVSGGWLHTGFAIYVQNSSLSFVPQSANKSNVVVDLSSSCALGSDLDMNTQLSRTPLVGNRDGETNVYNFGTATGVLKISLNNVPTSATELRLTSPSDDAPLSGTFNLVTGSPEIRMNEKVSGNSSRSITFSLTSAEARTFYIPVPVGTIPVVDGHSLKIELLEGDIPILTKSYKKALTIERNKVIPVTFDGPEWVTLGTGKFVDNFLWAKIVAKGLNKDIPGYVNVTIQKNIADPNKFRLVNPYGAAATQFEYTSPNAANRDTYLEFTVDGYTAGSAVTGFTTHRTGFAIDASNYNPELVYPTEYDAGYSPEFNKVVAGDASNPKIVQFAPVYRYNGSSTAYNYTTHGMNKHGVFRIIFPGVSNFGGSLTVPDGTNARLQKLRVTKETGDPARIKVAASTYTDYEIAAPYVNEFSVSTDTYPDFKSAANSSCDWDNTGLHNSHSISSGAIYLTWFTVDANNPSYVYDQGRLKVYYLNDEAPIGTYSNGTLSVTFDVSPNSSLGNIVLSSITNGETTYDATYNVFGTMSYSSSQWNLSVGSGQLYADYDTGLNHSTYGAMNKLSFQGLISSGWVDPCTAYIKDSDNKLYAYPYFVLRPTNDTAREAGGKFEGYAPYVDYTFDLYDGLDKQ